MVPAGVQTRESPHTDVTTGVGMVLPPFHNSLLVNETGHHTDGLIMKLKRQEEMGQSASCRGEVRIYTNEMVTGLPGCLQATVRRHVSVTAGGMQNSMSWNLL